ncbi:tripartite tricarboxylate transporter substrate binding protein [Variovorax sp. J22P168]|uniref:Bug family tripartite tricarboxylate transporter substrate binding protein n=1 Tax=Variovorax jilinensis TaxID=3053513 RepID=UPI0025786FA1|nr:tripartite tricarboxylate transporter substrate binding protein [Variovorax sp. J22P168]MDM0014836.1 tripartite tricarboxylate transporter substrate binding protein [Variovorax sp. J22P168]
MNDSRDSRLSRRQALAYFALTPLGASLQEQAFSQDVSSGKLTKVVCPYSAGSPVDVVGRYMAACLQTGIRSPVVVENIAGGGGITGTEAVLRAPLDGHTLLVQASGALTTTQLLNVAARFDAARDFTPLWGITSIGTVIVVGAQSPYRTIKDLMEAARAKPGTITYGSAGIGSTPHINTEMFMKETGVKLNHIPYRSSSAVISDMLGGHVDCLFASIASVVPLIQEGKLRGLAVLKPARFDDLPGVPTLLETGASAWMPPTTAFVLYAPQKLPAPLKAQIATATQRGFEADPEGVARLRTMGLNSAIAGQALIDYVTNEQSILTRAIKDAGIQAS